MSTSERRSIASAGGWQINSIPVLLIRYSVRGPFCGVALISPSVANSTSVNRRNPSRSLTKVLRRPGGGSASRPIAPNSGPYTSTRNSRWASGSGSSGRAGSILILYIYICAAGLGVCGGGVSAFDGGFGRGFGCPAWPEIGPNVVREEGQHLIRHLPLRLGQALLHETVDRDAEEPDARVEREMQLIEHRLALPQERRHLRHEVIDHAPHLPRVRLRVIADRGILQVERPLDVGHAQR